MNGKRRFDWREFWILWGAALLTFAAVILSTLAFVRFELHGETLFSILLKFDGPVISAVAVGVGLFAAHRVELGASILEAWLRGVPARIQWRDSLLYSLLAGVLRGAIWNVPSISGLNPNREAIARRWNEFAASPAGKALYPANHARNRNGQRGHATRYADSTDLVLAQRRRQPRTLLGLRLSFLDRFRLGQALATESGKSWAWHPLLSDSPDNSELRGLQPIWRSSTMVAPIPD
jgi:hypothetical protein